MDAGALQEVASQVAAARKQLEAQRALREGNLNVTRPSEDDLKQLDSSIKRNSALTKKLKQLTEENKQGILDDIRKTNQSKYVSEAVSAIAEAPLRNVDVPAAVAVCSLLHQRYADFGSQVAPALAKVFPKPGADASAAGGGGGDRDGAKRRRAALRLLGELVAAGVVAGSGPLLGVLKDLALPDYKRDREGAVTCLTLLGTFTRPARELLLGQQPAAALAAASAAPPELLQQADAGGLPEDVSSALVTLRAEQAALDEELGKRFYLPEAEAAVLTKVFDRAFEAASAALAEDHRGLGAMEAENAALVNTRGDLPPDLAAEYERRRKAYEALHRAVAVLAEGLGRPMPELAEDAFTRLGAADTAKDAARDAASREAAAAAELANEPAFEDPDARAFYESLPEVRVLVPSVLLFGDSKDPRAAAKEAAAAGSVAGKEGPGDKDGGEGAAKPPAEGTSEPDASSSADAPAPADAADASVAAEDSAAADGEAGAGGDEAGGGGGGDGGAMDLIVTRLGSCVSRDLADELAVNFCYINSKANRRRLVRALVDVPRAGLQLVPFFARVVAVLASVFPDVPQGVIASLESTFGQLLRRKDPTGASLEPRLRTARYLAELAKFRLLPPGSFFSALKQLLDDFSGHNIDSAAALVESAGRFMYRCPETRVRMENMLEVMMRLKNARNLDPRHGALIESAYFAVKPPSKAAAARRTRPPIQEYIRLLIFDQLSEATIPAVLRKLLKLPWREYEQYVVKCLLKVVRGRFSNIPLVSCLAAGLAQYHDSVGVALVDCVLEEIRLGLESPGAGLYQKRMADVRLLGELYNYMLCNSTPVFETLYLLLTFGHEAPELAERLDPPDDFFRVRLVCALLDACGQYFGEGAARSRLDRFLTFFQAYILSKARLPLDVEFDLQDVLHTLRPSLRRYDSYDEALAAVQDIIAKEVAQFGAPLGTIGEEEGEEDERRAGGGGGRGEDDADAEDVRGDARSLDDMSGRSEEDERVGSVPLTPVTGCWQGAARWDELDDDFEREWAALMGETQSRLGGLSLAPTPQRPAASLEPTSAASGPGGGRAGAGAHAGGHRRPEPDSEVPGGEGPGNVTLRMLVKRGGKEDRTKELQVPLSSAVALAVRQREEAEAREREEMKRLVLAANRQQEEEQAAAAGFVLASAKAGAKRSGNPRAAKYTGQLDISVLDDFGPSSSYDMPYVPYDRSAQQQQQPGGAGCRGGRGSYGRGRGGGG
ncbi:hypothetical protein HYH03_018672 [Edaphochlamys debaryana]|uniref:MIF4G domain-containing protein n=1 Tax=Edaphochlamys debaryana TaxID=47281 RepID=A0A836BP53_9CHLO|nr:hypothetical protein HYH03_018672 [Edaphochlamys debaryana]|eukprot:KAG2482394.1 hypothetical protein HYH03_018672 [Edaphochlamys debaryana]